jgi:NADPH:quinone reductase-like Zn-dependent oxidoreductase
MKAIVYTKYGPPSVLRIEEVGKPVPEANEVLVKVHATTVNRTDCGFRDPEPNFVRLFSGLLAPKKKILGGEFAGVVEGVGSDVTLFRAGDEVFGVTGDDFGAHAEYLCIREEKALAAKPTNMTFEEAAAVCDGAILAWSGLRAAKIEAGQQVLVYGASGAIGTATVQLAKYYGAQVTAVCNTPNLELVTSLGADRTIDYTQEDFLRTGEKYDLFLDAVGKLSFSRCKGVLKANGIYISTDLGFLWQNPFLALLSMVKGGKKVLFPIPKHTKQDIILLKAIIEAGKYRAVIDRRYPLEQIVEAYTYVETGQKVGNVVVNVEPAP